jgi:hypothetical protein
MKMFYFHFEAYIDEISFSSHGDLLPATYFFLLSIMWFLLIVKQNSVAQI